MAKRDAVERAIDAPVDAVWALLADADSRTEWNPTIISLDGPIEVGHEVRLVSTLDPKRTFELRVDEVTPPSRMVWSDGIPLGLFRGTRTYQLTERDGATAFAMTEVDTGPLAGLITRVIPDLTDSFEEFADGLKTAAESG